MKKERKFSKMYENHVNDIFRYLFVHVRDEKLAEDLTSETFSKAWQSIDKFDFKQPRPWLYKIAQNTMVSHWRKKSSLPLDENVEIEDESPSVEEQTDKKLDKERLHNALEKLPEEMRSVVSMRFLMGLSARDTGINLGLTESNVRVIQYRALKKLKGVLA